MSAGHQALAGRICETLSDIERIVQELVSCLRACFDLTSRDLDRFMHFLAALSD